VVKPVVRAFFPLEADLTYLNAGNAQFRYVILAAMVLAVGICGDAVAKVHKRHLHARGFTAESRAARAQFVPEQPAAPAPMRYFGGPKSPMWRG
jgi:hypothetical protein